MATDCVNYLLKMQFLWVKHNCIIIAQ